MSRRYVIADIFIRNSVARKHTSSRSRKGATG